MRKLYHYPICPLSRQIRIYLKELDLTFSTIKEDFWQKRKEFLKLNPASNVPVLEESFGLIVVGVYPIIEYLNDKYPKFNFFDEETDIKCEIRRLLFWFNDKFYHEVTRIIITEKVIRLMSHAGGPRTEFLKISKNYLTNHLHYLSKLLDTKPFIASDSLSCADIAAAAHLSIIDYFGEINWDTWPNIRHWYSILISRPSFRPLLQDTIPGFTPSSSYADLDF